MARSFQHRPLLVRVLNALGLVTMKDGLLNKRLDSEVLMDKAQARTGLDDFIPGDFIDPFRLLMQCSSTEPAGTSSQ